VIKIDKIVFVSRVNKAGDKLYITVPRYIEPLMGSLYGKKVVVSISVLEGGLIE